MKNIPEIFRKLNYLLTTEQKRLGIFVFICSILAAFLELLGVSVIVPLIDVLVSPERLYGNKYVVKIMPRVPSFAKNKILMFVIILVIIIYIIKNVFFIFNTWLKNKYAFKIQREISVSMLKKYISRGYEFFLNHNYSELRQGIDGDVRALYYIISNILQIVTQVMISFFIATYMILKDTGLAIGTIVTGCICLLLMLGLFRRKMSESGITLREYSIRTEKKIDETLHGIKMVMIGRKEKAFVDGYNEEVTRRNRVDVIKTAGSEIPIYLIEAISITGIMLSLCIRILSMDNPETFVSVLGAFAIGMFRILPAIGKISTSSNAIISSLPGLNSIYINMSYREFGADFLILDDEKAVDLAFSKEIEFKDICFKYEGSNDFVLKNIDFVIPKGSSVAIVGESGAGKSTLADIMLGLLKPFSGKITVDGIDMYKLSRKWWEKVAYVPQTIFLTDNSIRENVAYGLGEREIDDNRVENALQRANIKGFVDSLPNGAETLVGDRGVRLSGGQRQRLGIARALYNNPEILVLDEATSALDNETETAVMEAVESLMGDMTMLIIAHRLTTIRNCDYIYEIKDGCAFPRKYGEL